MYMPSPHDKELFFEHNNQEELYRLLAEKWNEDSENVNLTDPKATREYLANLTSKSLSELLREPTRLREEQAKVKREGQQLAYKEYPAFLHAHTCRHQLKETLSGLDDHLNDFLSTANQLQEACKVFTDDAQQIKDEREKISRVLEDHNVLTDLFEIPQLMDTCVWNGYYSEAMDLASQMRLLYVRYPLPIIKSIQDQVQTSSDLMLIQLISHLRKPIRLAAAMNVIGFLRRMDIFKSENEIRMIFLRCRDDYLLQKLARIRRDISDDPRQRSTETFEYLKRFIDVMREQMFEIGTQYVSIFPNEQGTLLSDYMIHIVEHIKHILKTHLHMIEDTSALNSLLTQLQYCGMSLGRIGLDFRHIFVDSFEEVIQPIIINFINASTDEFISKITKATEELSVPNSWMCSRTITASAGSVQEQVQPSNEKTQDEEEVNEEGQGEGGAEASTMKKQTFQPPMLLVNYPPLAIFTNNILSAFNALRLLPAISLYEPIQCHLEECFKKLDVGLKRYCEQFDSRIPDGNPILESFVDAYNNCCLPYLRSCLTDGIYKEYTSTSD